MSSDYHGYVIKDGKFIGAFEEMYRSCENPWPETEEDLDRQLTSVHAVNFLKANGFRKVFSVGLGKGLHANWLQSKIPDLIVEGCEISQTAVACCRERYPQIMNHCMSVEEFIEKDFEFDVIVFREILWYILPVWDRVVQTLSQKYRGKGIILEISCYDDQRYGRELFDGPDDIINKFPFQISEILRQHVSVKQREGIISIIGKI